MGVNRFNELGEGALCCGGDGLGTSDLERCPSGGKCRMKSDFGRLWMMLAEESGHSIG